MEHQLEQKPDVKQTYDTIRNSIVSAQHRLTSAVNSAMLTAYWKLESKFIKPAEKMTELNMAQICCTTYRNI